MNHVMLFEEHVSSKKKASFTEVLKKALYDDKHISTPLNTWRFDDFVEKWPEIKYGEGGEHPDKAEKIVTQPLDTENFEILHIDNEKMVFYAGGDWQYPYTVTVKLVNGKLTVTEFHPHKQGDGPTMNFISALKAIGAYDDYKKRKAEVDKRRKEKKETLNEGTWALEKDKIDDYKKELEAIKDPSEINDALYKRWWNVIGDDILYDFLDSAKDNENGNWKKDISTAIKRLKELEKAKTREEINS